ncbi:unnamed protein product [Nezara viridula]|uniref:Uncharacterized protein n=1 Tax=Nezara viridula TaxID=85310 RepID=A0A9P0HJN2_NEZVI|nr:unnamed protein product [Nezara viridula]
MWAPCHPSVEEAKACRWTSRVEPQFASVVVNSSWNSRFQHNIFLDPMHSCFQLVLLRVFFFPSPRRHPEVGPWPRSVERTSERLIARPVARAGQQVGDFIKTVLARELILPTEDNSVTRAYPPGGSLSLPLRREKKGSVWRLQDKHFSSMDLFIKQYPSMSSKRAPPAFTGRIGWTRLCSQADQHILHMSSTCCRGSHYCLYAV